MDSRSKQVVLIALVGVLVATAGCSALGFGSSATTNVLLVNNDETSHDVTVEVLNDGDSVYSEDVTVDAETDEELPAFEGSGEYVVAVTVDGETTEQTYEFTGDDTVSIGIANDATVTVGG
ncbi:hypothetical protein [Halobacterium noricense]|uniref:hypothetical protein n=1 Tax=Halobacterium noricense TaxID=223182 RepID=UPI001E4BFC83|nr:hypothetical protein [Halobacterium noricense]UHH26774.1 hypothetical protein LT974_07545 [Halobacterium noricense]